MKKRILSMAILLIVLVLTMFSAPRECEAVFSGEGIIGGQSYTEYIIGVGGSISVHYKSCTTVNITGPVTIKIWDSKGASVNVSEGNNTMSFRGSYYPSSTHRLVFEDGLADGDSTVNCTGHLSGEYDETSGAFTTFDTVVYGPSVDFLGGLAETGPWSIYYDPSISPIDGWWDLETGMWDMTLGVWFDCPNLRRADGTPIPMIEHAWGTFSPIVEPPTIISIFPDHAEQGETLAVTITGTNVAGVTEVGFGEGITVNSFHMACPTQIAASVTIDRSHPVGPTNVWVITPTGTATLTDGFTVEKKEGCFIAAAAYGTPMAEEIQVLREFRDEYLLTNPVGQAFVDFYYRVSPPIAEFITEHPSLKPIVRAGLMPAVAMSTVAINTTPAEKAAIIGLLVLVSVALAVWATRRRDRGPQYT